MRKIMVTLVVMFLGISSYAQDTVRIERKGFVLGLGLGVGAISISDADTAQDFDKGQGAITLPNLKFGYMLNEKTALLLTTSGMIYNLEGNDRSFETLLPSVQYWVNDNWWLNGGIGLALDMPALYDIKDNVNDDFNFGCGIGLAAGREVYKKKNFAIDLQAQITLGRTFLKGDGHRDAATFSVGVGFNWY